MLSPRNSNPILFLNLDLKILLLYYCVSQLGLGLEKQLTLLNTHHTNTKLLLYHDPTYVNYDIVLL